MKLLGLKSEGLTLTRSQVTSWPPATRQSLQNGLEIWVEIWSGFICQVVLTTSRVASKTCFLAPSLVFYGNLTEKGAFS